MPFELAPRFKRRFKGKTVEQRAAIMRCIVLLDENPRSPGLHSHRVQGSRGVWESYVNSSDRISWHYGTGKIVVRMNCSHDEVLRNP